MRARRGPWVFTFARHEGDTLRLLPKFTFYARAR